MNELRSSIRELLVSAEQEFGDGDAFRYKAKDDDGNGKKEAKVVSKSYTQLRNDSEAFSAALAALGEQAGCLPSQSSAIQCVGISPACYTKKARIPTSTGPATIRPRQQHGGWAKRDNSADCCAKARTCST